MGCANSTGAKFDDYVPRNLNAKGTSRTNVSKSNKEPEQADSRPRRERSVVPALTTPEPLENILKQIVPPPVPVIHEEVPQQRETPTPAPKPAPAPAPAGIPPLYGQAKITFSSKYKIGDRLGSGGFAVVFKCSNRQTREVFAVKKADRSLSVWNGRDALDDEIQNLQLLRNGPNIVTLYDTYSDKNYCHMVMELMSGGHLYDRLVAKKAYTEKEARDACKGLIEGVRHMHSKRIVHRDLKPENLLLVDEHSDTNLKISDFGFSRKVHDRNQLRTVCGTPGYMAPEILEQYPAYGLECDLWSVGVIMYELLGGCSPFGTGETMRIYERTRHADYVFYPSNFSGVSQEAKECITRLLTINPDTRMSATQALDESDNRWMRLENNVLSVVSIRSEGLKSITSAKANARDAFGNEAGSNRLTSLQRGVSQFTNTHPTRPQSIMTSASAATFNSVLSTKGRPYKDFYEIGDVLGSGGFAIVYRSVRRTTRAVSATKIVNIAEMRRTTGRDLATTMQTLNDEIAALKILRGGPSIVQLFDVFKEPDQIYMVMEEMKGGSLLERISKKTVYTEREARKVCRLIFEAINFCHNKRIAHRDMKPDNILMVGNDSDTRIKIADFGFAKKVKRPNSLSTFCGTPNYVAPEIALVQPYDERVDNWSVGVIVYVLLGGYTPFEGTTSQLLSIIPTGSYDFHEDYWAHISQNAQNLVASLLQVNPMHRTTAEQALQSDWMQAEEETLTVTDLSSAQTRMQERIDERKNARPAEKFRSAVLAVISANKLTSLGETGSRRREFLQMAKHADPMDIPEEIKESDEEEQSFPDVYTLGRELGHGSYSTVFLAKHRMSQRHYTVKRIDRKYLNDTDAVAVHDEISTLQQLKDCPKIVTIQEVYEEPDYGYVVIERLSGGNLLERISMKESYTEVDTKKIFANLLSGVLYCHDRRIANRALHADTIFLVSKDSDTDIKITDFGFAKKVLYPNALRTQCGKMGYVAPEILSSRPTYDVSCDMWSMGVMLFLLLGGYGPFLGRDDNDVMERTRYGRYEFVDKYWSHISNEAKNLIRRMLTVDPKKRITAREALANEWITAKDDRFASRNLSMSRNRLQSMVSTPGQQTAAKSVRLHGQWHGVQKQQ